LQLQQRDWDDKVSAFSWHARDAEASIGVTHPAPTKADSQKAINDNFVIGAPTMNLPKGGGAISGIGEKFAANPVTGTGSMSVPIFASPGRAGFGPQLSLSYDSGSGNGPFGFGWGMAVPAITRKTDKGLPRYGDGGIEDVFILAGAEDLVPSGQFSGEDWVPHTVQRLRFGKTYSVRRFRPRTEGLFSRIEHWQNTADASDVCWRTISKDNLTSWFGLDAQSRISDPENPAKIFSWLISLNHDDKGNVVSYGYVAENDVGIDRFAC
jgi:hypothetical protein